MPSFFWQINRTLRFFPMVCLLVTFQVGGGSGLSLSAQTDVPTINGIGNSLGFREHRPGMWSFIYPEIVNPSDTDRELEVVAFFALAQSSRFGKKIIVPAQSKLRVSLPIQVPPADQIPKRESTGRPSEIIRIQAHLYDLSGAEPKLLLNRGKRSYETDIGLRGIAFGETGEKYRSSAMLEPVTTPDNIDEEMAEEWVTASRIQFNQVGRVAKSVTSHLPESTLAFESIDQLVVDNDRLLHDAAGLNTVRRWLARGGNLWIMLDMVSEKTVERILGDSTPFQLIERTSLNEIQIKDADPLSRAAPPQPRFFEQPIDFARVIVTSGNIIHELDGWPASFWIRSGEGKVHFTTVGARAWIRDFDPLIDRTPDVRLGNAIYALTEQMQTFAYDMFAESKPDPVFDLDSVRANLINQIGYEVLPRRAVLLVFSIYTLTLAGCGIWFARNHRLDRLIFVGPLLSIMAGFIFFGMGYFSRKTVEPSVASFQMVEPIPAGNELRVDGLSVIYSDEQLDFRIGASREGTVRREQEANQENEMKIAWDQRGNWNFESGRIDPGIASYRVHSNVSNSKPISASAQFTGRGLEGQISGEIQSSNLDDMVNFEDMVLALPNGQFLSVFLQNDQFVVDSGNVLTADEFVRSSLLDDQQRWHQSIYRSRFPAGEFDRWVSRPTLFGWIPPLEMDIQFPSDFSRVGGALITIPFSIQKTSVGNRVNIPAAFINVENVLNARDAISGSFDARTGKWNGSIAQQSSVRLRFQLPPETLPLKLERATLKIDMIQGLNRTIELKTVLGQPQLIEKFENPNGSFQKSLTDAESLLLDDRGGFLVDVNIAVDKDFYDRQTNLASGPLRDGDRPIREMELKQEELRGISLQVSGTKIANNE